MADNTIIEVEQFKASVAAPPGMPNQDRSEVDKLVDYFKSLVHDDDDNFFFMYHAISMVNLKRKLKRGILWILNNCCLKIKPSL